MLFWGRHLFLMIYHHCVTCFYSRWPDKQLSHRAMLMASVGQDRPIEHLEAVYEEQIAEVSDQSCWEVCKSMRRREYASISCECYFRRFPWWCGDFDLKVLMFNILVHLPFRFRLLCLFSHFFFTKLHFIYKLQRTLRRGAITGTEGMTCLIKYLRSKRCIWWHLWFFKQLKKWHEFLLETLPIKKNVPGAYHPLWRWSISSRSWRNLRRWPRLIDTFLRWWKSVSMTDRGLTDV